MNTESENAYPFLHVRATVDEAFVGRIVSRLGGRALDGRQKFPDGVKIVDFLVDEYALEFKTLEQEPLTAVGRGKKLADFVLEQAKKGEAPIEEGRILLKGKASRIYWRKFIGVSIRRQLEAASKQIRSTRRFLGRPLHGAVFLVNLAAPFVDAVSFPNLIAAHQRDFADEIEVVIYLSMIPGIVPGQPKPAIPFGFLPEVPTHIPFAHAFMDAMTLEMSSALGKPLTEFDATKVTILPIRAPFPIPLEGGGNLNVQ